MPGWEVYCMIGLLANLQLKVNDASRFVIMGIDDKLNVLRFGHTCFQPVFNPTLSLLFSDGVCFQC